jgi:hypothetical protein
MKNQSDRIKAEVQDLIDRGQRLIQVISHARSSIEGDVLAEATMWVTRVGHVTQKLYGEKSQHRISFNKALSTNNFYNLHSNWSQHFVQVFGITKAIQHDIDNGLLDDLKTLIRGEIFSDFLEMGEHLLEEGYKDASAVIIGSVLEDGLRQLSVNAGLPLESGSGKPLAIDALNSQLAKSEIYSKLVQKQITSWAHVRNKAAHGEFSEYSKEQVQMMLHFVQSFSSEHLG